MKLNGYPVIHRRAHRDANNADPRHAGLEAVLVYRPDDVIPFVVATWSPSMGTSWTQGGYHADLQDAVDDFKELADWDEDQFEDPDRHTFPTRNEW